MRAAPSGRLDAKTNEIPELAPAIAPPWTSPGRWSPWTHCTPRPDTARHLVEDKHAHYLMIIKGNQPSLLQAAVKALAGADAGFAGATWAEQGKGPRPPREAGHPHRPR